MANETTIIDLQAGGIRDVQQAFATVEQAMLRLEKIAASSDQRQTKTRIAEAQKAAKGRIAAERLLLKDTLAAERDKLAATLRAERDRIKAADLSGFERRRALRSLLEESARMERELTAIVKQEVRAREQADLAAHGRTAQRIAQRRKDFGNFVGGAATRGISGAFGTISQYGGMALALGGSMTVGTAVQRGMRAETASVALANSMFNPNDAAQQKWLAKNGKNGRFDDKAILAFASQAQAISNIDKDELAKGWQDYIAKSSDWRAVATKEGQGTLVDLAKLAKATGSDFGQVMSAAGSLRVQNESLGPAEMMDMMRAIVGQGKMGAVEMKDLASHASVVTSGAGSYAMDQKKAQKALLGLSQIAIRTSGSPAEAATAVARFTSDVQAHAKKNMAPLGIDPLADKKTGTLKTPSEILADIFEKTKGNASLFGEGKGNVGLGRESVRIANALKPVYGAAVETAKGKGVKDEKELARIGADAVRKEVRKFETAGYDQKDIDEDFKRVMATSQERFDAVSRSLVEKLEVRLVPVLEKLAASVEKNEPQLERFFDGLGRLVAWFVENPFAGLGAIVGASVTKELAAAGMGKLLEKAMQTSLGQAGVVVGTAYITAELGKIAINEMASEQHREATKDFMSSTSAFAEAKSLEADIREGKMTPEKAKRLQELRAEMASQVQADVTNLHERSTFEKIGWILGGDSGLGKMLGADDPAGHMQEERNERLRQSKQALEELDKAIRLTATNLHHMGGAAASAANPNAPNRNGPMTTPARGGTGNR